MATEYLFVCGCPRSGTTALAFWLNRHPEICVGSERYSRLSMGRKMTPDLFEPERFINIRATDCGITDFNESMREVGLPERIRTARIVGDKQPRMYAVFDHINAVFPDAKFIYIGRNVFDVAASYKRRLLNPDDNWTMTVTDAVQHWNDGIAKTSAYRATGRPLLILEYERLFGTGQGLQEIGAFLGIDAKPFLDAAQHYLSAGLEIGRARMENPVLTAEERLFISRNANHSGHRELMGG